ncbi:MAG: ATP-dependent RecD-like DNA helicase [Eubacteriales bacterium SKADARSKE-1]|nr:ATP-dependent RecD-like DNA helicase [Eubacteriales bacterium SKADARSKE-1]
MQKRTMLELIGSVERIIFKNEQNGYSVIELMAETETVTVVGTMPNISVGENLKLIGNWKNHPTFGEQFSAEICEVSMPTSTVSILKYLSSGAIKGIGPSTATKLVETFAENTLEVMEKSPERLAQIPGISKSKALKIAEEFTKLFGIKDLMAYLGKYGITPEETVKIFKVYGINSKDLISSNPYILCDEPINIDFDKADKIAIESNTENDNICRIRAGIIFVLTHNMNNGHTCLPKDRLNEACTKFLEIDIEKVNSALTQLLNEGNLQSDIISEREFIFLNKMYMSETYIASRLNMIIKFTAQRIDSIEDKIISIEKEQNLLYADLQKEAIRKALQEGILILTGGPGTGKTTTLNAIIKILEAKGEKVFLAAPTGRAAKRMSELTKKESKTIHRMLEVAWDNEDKPIFKRNEKNLLKCDTLILDELSMIDVTLFEGVLKALPLGCRLIMVGDSNQLPSVGAGNVLDDLIKSEILPVVELKEIFRQASTSLIVTNAHKIVNGELPDLSIKDNDFFFLQTSQPENISETIKDLCKNRLPNAYGYSPLFDIQVIAPGRKGPLGTFNLNKILQDTLNPKSSQKTEIIVNGNVFRVGDKVMQIKNNYDIPFIKDDTSMGEGIFNGDIGILTGIDNSNSTVSVKFDDKLAHYDMETITDLELAYAVTVHKSQGSEFCAVVMPMYYGAPQLYYRNLLYTGVTRAKNLLIMVGTPWTIAKMVENNKKTRRYSGLCEFLRK